MLTDVLRMSSGRDCVTVEDIAAKLNTSTAVVRAVIQDLIRTGYMVEVRSGPFFNRCTRKCCGCAGSAGRGKAAVFWKLTEKGKHHMEEKCMQSLDTLESGAVGKIDSLAGSGSFLARAASIGFVSDTDVVVVRNGKRGALIVRLKDSDIAVGRKEARRIKVKEVSQ